MRGSVSRARARARRWRCPPESVTPRSPTTRVVAVGEGGDELVRLRRRGRRLDLRRRGARPPKAMFSAMVRENRNTSCSMMAIWRRSAASSQSRTSTPSTRTAPAVTS